MRALATVLPYFALSASYMDSFISPDPAPSLPPISRNTHRTKGRKFASQKERANRRKAKVKR